MDKEQIMQLQIIEQESNQLNQQTELIDQNLSEIQELKNSLEEIERKECEEMLVNIGKKIFVPVKITDKNFIIEVGNKNFVKKSVKETRELVIGQIEKLLVAKEQVLQRIKELEDDMNDIIKKVNDASRSHDINENCEYEDSYEKDHDNKCGKNHKH
ncbi:MAG: prefoldin subunit alpha [Nanoarchaeota archaeon]|nr:prefoldin subunit alpha [Nanoarchaeota archaeon]